jgi:ligand-binding sensor domain-containing protein
MNCWRMLASALVCLGLGAVLLGSSADKISSPISEYIHKTLGSDNGYSGGPVYAIAQTNDGYLWIGAEKGLLRFDGLNFQLFQHTDGSSAPLGPVLGLTTDAKGNLWVRLGAAGLLRYHDGKFDRPVLERAETVVSAIARSVTGNLLLAALHNGVMEYRDGRFQRVSRMPHMPNFLIISMAQMNDGTIWLGTRDTGLYQLVRGEIAPGPAELHDRKVNCLLAGENDLWIGTDNGLTHWNGRALDSSVVPASLRHEQVLTLTRDRNSNVWIGTANGLFRIDEKGAVSHDRPGRLPNVPVTAIFEDREGDIWSGSSNDLLQLRRGTFTTYSPALGFPSTTSGALYADSDGHIWFASSEGGVYWEKDGRFGEVKNTGLEKEIIYSIAGGNDGIWIGRQSGGLTRIPHNGAWGGSKTYTQANGLAQNSVYAVYEAPDGTVWAGTLSGGVSRLRDGRFTTYTTFDGLLSNTITAIVQTRDGTMWFGTPRGVNSLSHEQWTSYGVKSDPSMGEVNCLFADSQGVLWIGTASGISTIQSGQVVIPAKMPELLREPVLGIAEDQSGSLWLSTSNHIMRVNREKLLVGSVEISDIREYATADGLRSTEGVKRSVSVLSDSAHRIWLSTSRGLSSVDPLRERATTPPALVHIQQVFSDGEALALSDKLAIPAPHHRVTIRFTGLSLAVPERVRFKYMLDSFDQKWSEPTDSREVTYTNLDSGSYRFHVRASNSDGIWNSAEPEVRLELQPLLWERWWFRVSAVAALAIAILLFIQLRMLRMSRQLNMRFEERLSERTRIARELHDTLLQGVISASMQLHVAAETLPSDSPARPSLQRILQLMAQVTEEGRNTVHGLRSSADNTPELEAAFSQIPEEFVHREGKEFRVLVQGHAKPLRAPIREEVYNIVREAIVNAFRHSRAANIDVQLEYGQDQLRIIVGDDGCGIDPLVLKTGREGHWGLSGMRERAKRIGARLRVLSRPAAGTEVELSVPSQVAYGLESAKSLSNRMKAWVSKGKKWSTDL